MHYAGFCRLCETGPLGVRKCGGCQALLLLCDECDAVWTTADPTASPVTTDDPDLPCPHCRASLVGDDSSWANAAEIAGANWLADAVGAGTLTLRTGKPFAPSGPAEISPTPTDDLDPRDEPCDAGG
ncbi:MAG: hypothetical protein AAGB00_05105 [Planctomycetota bacterium]